MMRNLVLILASALLAGWLATAAEAEGRPDRSAHDRRSEDRDARRPGPPSRHRPPDGRGPPWRDKRPPFSRRGGWHLFHNPDKEQIEEILAFVREHMPWRYERLQALRRDQPEMFKASLRRLRFEIMQLKRLKRGSPKAFDRALEERRLRRQAAELAAQARQAENPDRKARLTEQLRGVLARLLDAEIKTREIQIRELEHRLEQLRQQLRQRAEHRSQVIDDLVEKLLAAQPGPDDEDPHPGPP